MSGGGKQRKKSRNSEARAQDFANQGISRFDPFVEQGQQASNQLAAFAGLGSASDQAAAKNAFTNSLFYQGGQNAFGLEKDAIDSALSAQGLNFSSARLNAVEDARQRNFQNAFSQFLNNTSGIANAGFGAVQAQAGLNQQQGANAL